MISLLDIYATQNLDAFLYELLEQRKPWQNISHKKMPSYEEHVDFIESKPYMHWYVIRRNISAELVGSIYISNYGEIGIFLLDKHQGQGYGKLALEELMKKHIRIESFYANIAPLNSRSQAFFLNRGFRLYSTTFKEGTKEIMQYTYYKLNPYHEPEVLPCAHRQLS